MNNVLFITPEGYPLSPEVYFGETLLKFTHIVLPESTLARYQKKNIQLETLKRLWSEKQSIDLNQVKVNLVDMAPVERGYELYLYLGKAKYRFIAKTERDVKLLCYKAYLENAFSPNEEEQALPTKEIGEKIKQIQKDLGFTLKDFVAEFRKRKFKHVGSISTLSEIQKGMYKNAPYAVLEEALKIEYEVKMQRGLIA